MNGSPFQDTFSRRAFWAVVPAGGSGTRLWPLGRAARPKFLLPLLGTASLLQDTVARLGPLAPPARTLVACGPAHAAAVARQLPDLPEDNVGVEPSPKGSGPAIGLATALVARRDPGAVVGSFAADRAAVVPAELGWSDVGDWHGLGELIAHDDRGNSVRGDIVQVDTRRSVVWSETDRVVALVGIENTAVVDTADALLVVNRDRAQDVKRIVERLKRARRTELS